MENNHAFLLEVNSESGENIQTCYQCLKCSNGCPFFFTMDYLPHQIIRMIMMNRRNQVLESSTIWVCGSCQTCVTRCPMNIDIPRIMDVLREISFREISEIKKKPIPLFHSSFLKYVQEKGRLQEFYFLTSLKLKSGLANLTFDDLRIASQMVRKRKLNLSSNRIEIDKKLKNLLHSIGKD